MAPIRKNKGKQKIDFEDKSESRPSGESSLDQRPVVFYNQITPLVSPSKAVDNFKSLFKVSRKTFNYICSTVREPMMSKDTNFKFSDGKSMSLNDQVAIALRRLSSVDSPINIANFFGTNHSTILEITWGFTEALEDCGIHHIIWPTDMARIKIIKSGFEKIEGLPNCCGAIGTTHLKMHPQTKHECETNMWLDLQNNNSMMLQVIVDPKMRIMDVVAGWPGHMTIDTVLQKSRFFEVAQKGTRLNGDEVDLSYGTKVGEYIVGGTGFPLLPWLMTPYQDEQVSEDQSEFNKKHAATTMVAHRTLKRLKEAWAVIDGGMWRPGRNRLSRIVLACCILHNILIHMEGEEVVDEATVVCEHDPGYPPEKSALADKDAIVIRDKLCLYLAGKLPA